MEGKSGEGGVVAAERAMCAIDSWIHLFFANIVFGFSPRPAASRPQRRPCSAAGHAQRDDRAQAAAGVVVYVKVGENCSIVRARSSGMVALGVRHYRPAVIPVRHRQRR
jgi:hypothetical protein